MQGGAPQFGMPQQPQPAPGYGGYPQQEPQQPQQPAAQGYPSQGYPAQLPQQPAYGGYPAPDQGYPAPQAGAPGVGGITQGMGGMNLGGQPQAQPQPQAQAPRAVMNQLYPTDLLNQPFNASELDLPPPPITLPPNVSPTSVLRGGLFTNDPCPSRASPPPLTPTARLDTSDRHSTLFPRRTPCSRSPSCPSLWSSSRTVPSTTTRTMSLLFRTRSSLVAADAELTSTPT